MLIGIDNKHVADDLETIVNTFRLLDSENYERALEFIDDDFEMVTTADIASEPGLYSGPDGVRRWWETFLEAMEYVRLEIRETHPVDDGRTDPRVRDPDARPIQRDRDQSARRRPGDGERRQGHTARSSSPTSRRLE